MKCTKPPHPLEQLISFSRFPVNTTIFDNFRFHANFLHIQTDNKRLRLKKYVQILLSKQVKKAMKINCLKIPMIFFLITTNLTLFSLSEDEINEKELHAVSMFRQGKNQETINLLSELINSGTENDKKFRNQIKETYYWLGKAYIRCNNFEAAKKNLEFYIANFKDYGENYEDAYYENAMMYYTEKKYQTAADLFVNFLNEFPGSANAAKVCYQTGESLYELALYDDSLVYFKTVIDNYSASNYYEAAVFRAKLIESRKNELVLQNLLKWSQEQFLASRDTFIKKEQEANDTIKLLKDKIKILEREIASKENIVEFNYEQNMILESKEELLKRKEIILKLIEKEIKKSK